MKDGFIVSSTEDQRISKYCIKDVRGDNETVVAHIPDYIDKAFAELMCALLNENNKYTLPKELYR